MRKRLPGAVKVVQDKKGKTPKTVGNFQRILEDKRCGCDGLRHA